VDASQYIASLGPALERLAAEDLARIEGVLLRARDDGGSIFILGNGGSAATASHLANDLNKGASVPGEPRFRAVALTDNVPLITAWANDTRYDRVFVEQLMNLLRAGDVVVAFSGSGNSPNVLAAVEWARGQGAVTIGFTGGTGGRLRAVADYSVVVPADRMEHIEDLHLVVSHALSVSLRHRIAGGAALPLPGPR